MRQKLQIRAGNPSPRPQGGRGAPNDVHTASWSADSVRGFQAASRAANTRRAYESDWQAFDSWCSANGHIPLPAEPLVIANYLAAAAEAIAETGAWRYAPSTIGRWLSSINKAHTVAGHPKPGAHPDVELTIAGIRRIRKRPARRRSPLLLEDLRLVLKTIDRETWPAAVRGHRDTLVLLIGWAGAFRRSEIAGLTVADVALHTEDGLHVRLVSSKTDQEGHGGVKAIPYGADALTCGPCAHVRWLHVLATSTRVEAMRAVSALPSGHVCRTPLPTISSDTPLFPSLHKSGAMAHRSVTGQTINDIVKLRVAAAGIDAANFGGHSLRAGFVTQALRSGATPYEVMRQTFHRDVGMVEVYDRENNPLRGNAVAKVGL